MKYTKSITYTLFAAANFFAAEVMACTISAKTTDQQATNIEPVKGHWLLIQAWTLDCIECERQKPDLSKLNSEYSNFTAITLSLDGASNMNEIKSRIQSKNYSMNNYVSNIPSFREQMSTCFNKPFVGTPTYILYSPKSEVMAVKTGPIDLAAIPNQLNLTPVN